MKPGSRSIRLVESARVPLDGALLGWAAVLPLAALAAWGWLGDAPAGTAARAGARLWGAALLLFFSGVRRGLSFRTPAGPTMAQMLTFGTLFLAGLGVLLAPLGWALATLIAAFLLLAIEDPRAARRGEAPLYFTRLRPWQMVFAALATGLCWLAR